MFSFFSAIPSFLSINLLKVYYETGMKLKERIRLNNRNKIPYVSKLIRGMN